MIRTRIKLSILCLIILSLLIFTACSNSSSGDGDSASGNGGTVELKLGHMNSPEHVQDTGAMTPFSKDVEELTDGRVKFQVYPGGALGGPTDTFDNIVTGIMDAGW